MSDNEIKPGWYEDVADPQLLRWWDGNQFTDNVRSKPASNSGLVGNSVDKNPAVDAAAATTANMEEDVKKDMSNSSPLAPPVGNPVVAAHQANDVPAAPTSTQPVNQYSNFKPQQAGNGQYPNNGQPPYRPDTRDPLFNVKNLPLLRINIIAIIMSGIMIFMLPMFAGLGMVLVAFLGAPAITLINLLYLGIFVNQLVQGIRGVSKPNSLDPKSHKWKALSIVNIVIGGIAICITGLITLIGLMFMI